MENKRIKEKLVLKKEIKREIEKGMFVLVIGISIMILLKNNTLQKEWIQKNIFEKSLPNIEIRKWYQKYMSMQKDEEVQRVFQENRFFQEKEKTDTGIKVKTKEKEIVPSLESGILVLVEDEKAILEQVDGVSAIYKNIKVNNYKLYDYIEKGDILGESTSTELKIDFQKNGEFYDYQKNL